tara:strand:+ start:256 stop:480 length:225 start_codon:yes stop_codon:yes gene_type:complete
MMEAVLSNILDKIETIDDLIEEGKEEGKKIATKDGLIKHLNENKKQIEEAVDDLWGLVHDEMHQGWLKSVMEVT